MVFEKVSSFLAQDGKVMLELKKDLGEELAVEKERSDDLKDRVTDLTGRGMKVGVLPRKSRSKQRISLEKVKILDAQKRSLLDHLRTLRSRMPGFQARVAESVVDECSAFLQGLATALPHLDTARLQGIGAALVDSIAPLQDILAAFETDLARSSPTKTGSCSASQ